LAFPSLGIGNADLNGQRWLAIRRRSAAADRSGQPVNPSGIWAPQSGTGRAAWYVKRPTCRSVYEHADRPSTL